MVDLGQRSELIGPEGKHPIDCIDDQRIVGNQRIHHAAELLAIVSLARKAGAQMKASSMASIL